MHKPMIKKLLSDETGIAAIEYGLIASLIAVGLGATLLTIGDEVEESYSTVATEYAAANAV